MINKQLKCTIIRSAWIVAMAIITVSGAILFFEFENHPLGIPLMLIGVGLFVYKTLIWVKEDNI